MIEPRSAIGFALAFLVVSWAFSAILGATVLVGRAWLGRRGPSVERAAAAGALALGPVVAFIVVLSLSGYSLGALWLGLSDHCAVHGHHPHLCWIHGAGWASNPAATVPLAMVAAYVLIRAVQKLSGAWTAARALGRLERAAVAGPGEVLIAPADRVFCFAAGIRRPRIFVSSAAWRLLDDSQRRAVVAHERAHLAAGDLLRDPFLGFLALLGAPMLARHVLTMWRSATERVCDARAADEVDAAAVASALLVLARAGGTAPVPAGVAFASPAGVVERVEALLAEIPAGGGAARRLGRGLWMLVLTACLAAVLLADPLHHALETLLGVF